MSRIAVNQIIPFIQNHAPELLFSAGLMATGWILGRHRSRRQWKRREFLERVNVSLNLVENGTLLIRTLLEKRCADVFLNSAACDVIVQAARKTTAEDSLLPLPDSDYWHYLNPVLNEISEKYSTGFIRRDLGLETRSATYLICLTAEVAPEMRMRKIRAMVIQESLLTNFPAEDPAVERDHHRPRITTLRQLAAAYRTRPDAFLKMEICI